MLKSTTSPETAEPGDIVGLVLKIAYRDGWVCPEGAPWVLVASHSPARCPQNVAYRDLDHPVSPDPAGTMILLLDDLLGFPDLTDACDARSPNDGDTDRFNLFLTAEAALLQHENYYEEIFAGRYFEDPPCQDHVEDSLLMLAPRPVSSHDLVRKLPALRRHAEMFRSLCPVPDETGETIFPAVPDFLLTS